MTEQDYRTVETPGLPLQPTAIHPTMPTAAPTAVPAPTLPTIPAAEPVVGPVGLPIAEPVAPVVEPASEPVVEPFVEAEVEPVAEAVSPSAADDAEEAEAHKIASRPASASRKARRPAGGARKITRYTLDLEAEMHRGLRLYAVSENVDASKVMRALLWLLMANQELPAGVTLSDLVLDEIFGTEDE